MRRGFIIAIVLGIITLALFMFDLFKLEIISLQRSIHQLVIDFVARVERNPADIGILFFIFIYSYLYGVIHAAGPGHGKTVLSANLLPENKKIISAFTSSSFSAITHVGSAVIIALSIKLFMIKFGHFDRINMNTNLIKVNGVFIMIIGIAVLVSLFLKKSLLGLKVFKNDKFIGIIAGMVPCPATMTIVFIAVAKSVYLAGSFSILGIISGIFSTLLLVSVMTVLFKDRFFKQIGNNILKISRVIKIIQGTMFLVIGFFLYY